MNCGICCPECLCDTVNCDNKLDCYNNCNSCDTGSPFACNTSSPTTSYPTTNIPTSTTSTPSNAPLTNHEYCQVCCSSCPIPTEGYCADCYQHHCANCTVTPTTTSITQVECPICCPACLCSLDSESPYCKDSCFPQCNDCSTRRRLFDCNETTLIPTTSNPTTFDPTTVNPTTTSPTTVNTTTFIPTVPQYSSTFSSSTTDSTSISSLASTSITHEVWFLALICSFVIIIIILMFVIILYCRKSKAIKSMKSQVTSKSIYINNAMCVLLSIGDYQNEPENPQFEGYCNDLAVDIDIKNLLTLFRDELKYDVFPQYTQYPQIDWTQDQIIHMLQKQAQFFSDNVISNDQSTIKKK
eukprot:316398_1